MRPDDLGDRRYKYDSETVLGHSALKKHKAVTQRPKDWGVRQEGRGGGHREGRRIRC